MSPHDPNFDDVQDVVTRLGAERPSVPPPDPDFTKQLRNQLLMTPQKTNNMRWLTMASGAIALVTILFFAVTVWQQSPITAGEEIEIERPSERPSGTLETFEETIHLMRFDVLPLAPQPGNEMRVMLEWESTQDKPNLSWYAHLLSPSGELIMQSDYPVGTGRYTEWISWVLPELLSASDQYQVEVGLYDHTTGERVKPRPFGNGSIFFNINIGADHPSISEYEVSLVAYNGYTLEDNLITTSFSWETDPEANLVNQYWFVHLYNEHNFLLAQQQSTMNTALFSTYPPSVTVQLQIPDELPSGSYQLKLGFIELTETEAALYQTGTPNNMFDIGNLYIADGGEDVLFQNVWLIKAERGDLENGRYPYTVTLGYNLSYWPTDLALKLHFANPGWQAVTEGQAPIDGVTDFIPIDKSQNEMTLSFSVPVAEMTQIIGTEYPLLVAIVKDEVDEEAGLAISIMSDPVFWLVDTNE